MTQTNLENLFSATRTVGNNRKEEIEPRYIEPRYVEPEYVVHYNSKSTHSHTPLSKGIFSIKLDCFLEASKKTGDFVKIMPEFACCPALIGNDNSPVFLYELIEALDGVVDYEEIKEELPSLSFAQIHAAISFLRQLASFNAKGIDIDDVENEAAHSDLIETLRRAFADKGIHRVLHQD